MRDHYASDDPARPMTLTSASIALWIAALAMSLSGVGILLWVLGQVTR